MRWICVGNTALQKATAFTSYTAKSHLTGAEDVVGVGVECPLDVGVQTVKSWDLMQRGGEPPSDSQAGLSKLWPTDQTWQPACFPKCSRIEHGTAIHLLAVSGFLSSAGVELNGFNRDFLTWKI